MLTGYLDSFSYSSGEQIEVRVSTDAPTVDIDLVRLIHGDTNPAGPGFQVEHVAGSPSQRAAGQQQPLRPGSFMLATQVVPTNTTSLDIEILAWPTTPSLGRVQGLLSLLDEAGDCVVGLALDEQGRLATLAGDKVVARTPNSLLARRWYRLQLTANSTSVELRATPLSPVGSESATTAVGGAIELAGARDVLLAALSCPFDEFGAAAKNLFNGKLEQPQVRSDNRILAHWAFERGQESNRASDISGAGWHGQLFNGPARAMTGHNWNGRYDDHRTAPDQYGAIHFHDDDLIDAGWGATATLSLPSNLTSGVYAVRLTDTTARGDADELPSPHVDHIPFVVRSKKSKPAPVAFLLPTYTYVAYANERLQHRLDYKAAGITDHPIEPGFHDRFLAEHPEFGLSLYDTHTDGSGVCYSSHLRPIPNLRPDYRMWLQNAPRHLSADLYMIAFFEQFGIEYDVLTDHDLNAEGAAALNGHQVVVTGSHPEYYSERMLDALQSHLDTGGSLMYLGGNGFYWVTSSSPEQPEVLEVRRSSGIRTWEAEPGEHRHSSTGELGGLWRWRGRTPHKMVGVGMCSQGWDEKAPPFVRSDLSYKPEYAWVFDGITDHEIGDFGLIMNGASGDELDRCDHMLGSPPNAVVLATSAQHSNYYQLVVEDVLMLAPGLGGADCKDVRSDMVLVEQPSGGAVFSVGSICFTGSLPVEQFTNNVAQLILNVLNEFSARKAKTD